MQGVSVNLDPRADGSGHRSRLRKRLFDGGPKALLDHEVVEYLLALAIPRRDTRALAKQLVAQFGGIGPVLSADAQTLARAGLSEGVVAALKIAEATALRLLEKPGSKGGPCCRAGMRLATISRRQWAIRRSRKCACCSSTPRIC